MKVSVQVYDQGRTVYIAVLPATAASTITEMPVKEGQTSVNVLDVIAPAIAADLEAAGLKLAPFRWPVPAKPAKKG